MQINDKIRNEEVPKDHFRLGLTVHKEWDRGEYYK